MPNVSCNYYAQAAKKREQQYTIDELCRMLSASRKELEIVLELVEELQQENNELKEKLKGIE